MARLEKIQNKIFQRQYEFSKHAVDQSIIRDIGVTELEEAILGASEILEDYPNDKYGPSCLVLGLQNLDDRYMYSVVIPAAHLLRSSHSMNLTPIYG